ncbi:acyltransferase [Streptomyces longispororuber]|uniref:Acyltransferase n=1 Tax=Streptomyces longispororuber TaxID=68230 RepID=A0A918ZZT5_9ACTN|nr:acyltransferase [Streptomyces longispororuber]GHE79075.1 acyltransferase [Streptomyces longispororuber]
MPPPSAACQRLPSLAGLRWFASLAVFVCHVAVYDAVVRGGMPSTQLFLVGTTSVSFFFVLSGFVLTYARRNTDTARLFWRRRLARVYPNHLVVWSIVMLLFWGLGVPRADMEPGSSVSAFGDMANALLVNTLVPVREFAAAGNSVAWSLTCDLLFYLLFPVLFPLVARIPGQWLVAAAFGTVAVVWLVPLLITLNMGSGPPGSRFAAVGMSELQFALLYMFPFSRLPEFVLGMILARMHTAGAVPGVHVVSALCLLGATLFVGPVLLPMLFMLTAATVVPVALLILAAAATDARGATSWLRTPTMVYLGDLSYGFYLIHLPVILGVLHYSGGTWEPAWTASVSLAMAFPAAVLLYALVERPCMRRFSARRTKAATGAPLAVGEEA